MKIVVKNNVSLRINDEYEGLSVRNEGECKLRFFMFVLMCREGIFSPSRYLYNNDFNSSIE